MKMSSYIILLALSLYQHSHKIHHWILSVKAYKSHKWPRVYKQGYEVEVWPCCRTQSRGPGGWVPMSQFSRPACTQGSAASSKVKAFVTDVSLDVAGSLAFGGPFQEAWRDMPTPARNQRLPRATSSWDLGTGKQASMTTFYHLEEQKERSGLEEGVLSQELGAEQALPIFRVFVFLKEKEKFSAHTPAQLSAMINDGPFFKFPFCSAWGLASVDVHSTRINGFGKPTRLSTWQQMVQLKAFVVLMLGLAATWSSYHLINNEAATALGINCPLYFAGPTVGADSFMMVEESR